MDKTSYPAPTFIGLRRKERRAPPAGWCNTLQTEHVVEICSVSNCIAGAPDIWLDGFGERIYWTTEKSIDAWTSTNAARQSELQSCCIDFLPEERLCLYAFRAFPWMFARAAPPVLLEPRQLFAAGYALPLHEPEWSDYERLGYDVVQFEPIRLLDLDGDSRAESSLTSVSYGCSPLSCNGLACDYPVNSSCLLEDVETAFQAGLAFGREEPEPAPYVIIEVLRRRERGGSSSGCRA